MARIEGSALQALFTRWPKLRVGGRALANPLAQAHRPKIDRKTAGYGGPVNRFVGSERLSRF
jgi:hypothetical protein